MCFNKKDNFQNRVASCKVVLSSRIKFKFNVNLHLFQYCNEEHKFTKKRIFINFLPLNIIQRPVFIS